TDTLSAYFSDDAPVVLLKRECSVSACSHGFPSRLYLSIPGKGFWLNHYSPLRYHPCFPAVNCILASIRLVARLVWGYSAIILPLNAIR
ncbi:MAG TPA: hypothetical protein VJJ55_01575, partial [Candidatus Paceibacterota bacterium]